jgi:hypothetical protein
LAIQFFATSAALAFLTHGHLGGFPAFLFCHGYLLSKELGTIYPAAPYWESVVGCSVSCPHVSVSIILLNPVTCC